MDHRTCTCLGLPMGPGQTCDAHQLPHTLYAWCFSHGTMHHFIGQPWCTATWVSFTTTTEADALEAKQHAYGDARFLHELPAEQQLGVIEIGSARS